MRKMTNKLKKNNRQQLLSWVPVKLEVIPKPEHPIPPTYHETPDDDDDYDYDYDYDQLKDEYLELLEEVKSHPLKERKKLSKLKNEKKLKSMVNKVIIFI